MTIPLDSQRRIGLVGATFLGVGAIVGGGILALAGVALERTGAGSILAFAINGLIAVVTALSFAELATAYPQSGGTYLFAKRVLTVSAAFAVGWVVWFASIMASVLYALGFAAFASTTIAGVMLELGMSVPAWVSSPVFITALAVAVSAISGLIVVRSSGGGGNAVSVAKVIVFAVLILGGIWVWVGTEAPSTANLSPLLPHGVGGLVQAMGYTFIAFQGFDLIAAVAGEVKEPRRTLPRAMLWSLAIAFAVYLPLLLIVLVVGIPDGVTVSEFASANTETVLAEAARNYLGRTGFWLVICAGLLSMISALMANLFAGSRIAHAMARDRTLPAALERVSQRLGTPVVAANATTGLTIAIVLLVTDVASAGAAASLIFLVTFALAQGLCILARARMPGHSGFRVPFWPYLPTLGALSCIALALFQGYVVPTAGAIAGAWLLAGAGFYLWLIGHRARVQDAVHEAVDADLLELRGLSPLVLVPTGNASKAGVMALMAACISPPRVGRVLILNVVPPLNKDLEEKFREDLAVSAAVLRDSLSAAVRAGARTEALATFGQDPSDEIERVARTYQCTTLLMGMSRLSDSALRGHLERLVSRLSCNVVIFRCPDKFQPKLVRRALVPIRGIGTHSALRARLLSSLRHRAASEMEVEYLLVLPADTSDAARARQERLQTAELRAQAGVQGAVRTVLSDDVGAAISEAARDCDLLILGLSRVDRSRRVFAEMTRKVIADTECATLVISERR